MANNSNNRRKDERAEIQPEYLLSPLRQIDEARAMVMSLRQRSVPWRNGMGSFLQMGPDWNGLKNLHLLIVE
jgi:hypothetical protein